VLIVHPVYWTVSLTKFNRQPITINVIGDAYFINKYPRKRPEKAFFYFSTFSDFFFIMTWYCVEERNGPILQFGRFQRRVLFGENNFISATHFGQAVSRIKLENINNILATKGILYKISNLEIGEHSSFFSIFSGLHIYFLESIRVFSIFLAYLYFLESIRVFFIFLAYIYFLESIRVFSLFFFWSTYTFWRTFEFFSDYFFCPTYTLWRAFESSKLAI